MSVTTSLVYDLPTRIFHWLFAILFVAAFSIAQLVDDDSPLYAYHMLAGLLMIFMLALRALWGIVGSRYARFSSFRLSPNELITYLKLFLCSKTKRHLGHNPASSYAALAMFIFTLGLGATGILISKDINKHFLEDVHELCANGFIITVIGHVVGVVFHNLKHRDGMIRSMFNGKKEAVAGEVGINSNRPVVAVIFVGLLVAGTIYLKDHFDSNTQILNMFGSAILLGENEDD